MSTRIKKARKVSKPEPAAPVPATPAVEEQLPPGVYFMSHIGATREALAADIRAEERALCDWERRQNMETVENSLADMGLPSFRAMMLKTNADGSTFSRDGGVEVRVSLPYRRHAVPDRTRLDKLRARSSALRTGLTAAAHFASFCRTHVGGKSNDPLPVSRLDELWSQWIDFTCGSKPPPLPQPSVLDQGARHDSAR